MRRITDTIGAVIIMALVVNLLFKLLEPYAPFIAIAVVICLIAGRVLARARYW